MIMGGFLKCFIGGPYLIGGCLGAGFLCIYRMVHSITAPSLCDATSVIFVAFAFDVRVEEAIHAAHTALKMFVRVQRCYYRFSLLGTPRVCLQWNEINVPTKT